MLRETLRVISSQDGWSPGATGQERGAFHGSFCWPGVGVGPRSDKLRLRLPARGCPVSVCCALSAASPSAELSPSRLAGGASYASVCGCPEISAGTRVCHRFHRYFVLADLAMPLVVFPICDHGISSADHPIPCIPTGLTFCCIFTLI